MALCISDVLLLMRVIQRAKHLYATSGSDDTVMESVNRLWFSGVRDDNKTVVVEECAEGCAEECAEECIEVTPSDFFKSKEHLPWHQGPKRMSLARWWFTNPLKRHYRRCFFSPLQKPGEISVDEYNFFRGLAIPRKTTADAAGRERSRARAQPVLDHILHIWCQRDPKLYDHVLKWLAYQVQHPGKKTGVLPILCGPHGAGKVRSAAVHHSTRTARTDAPSNTASVCSSVDSLCV